MSESSRHPYPPFELAARVDSLPFGDRFESFLVYEFAGREFKEELLRMLPEGIGLEGKRVLDFGCGAGRALRQYLAEARTGEFWGADLDAESIEWMREHLCPPLNVVVSKADPPLPFESGSFDLAWAISVFTHLAGNSAAWLLELHRILRPGGLLMASRMGEWTSEEVAGEPWDENRIGMNTMQHDAPWASGGPMVLISDWWAREHWGRAFEFVSVKERVRDQTWLLLRKKDVTLTPEELLAPSDDPREWTAMRHNVTQLQRELECRSAAAQASSEALQAVYENSTSWRAMRPLRELRKRLG